MGANESKPRTKRSFLNSFSVANAATTEDNIDNVLPKSPLAPDTPGSQSGPSYDTAKLFEPGKLEDFVDDSPSSPFFEKDDSDDPEVARKNLEIIKKLKNDEWIKFLKKSEEVTNKADEQHNRVWRDWVADFQKPFWKKIPPLAKPNGRPMPRFPLGEEWAALAKFYDFYTQFQFGLWGFRQRSYPVEKPFDFQQAYGPKNLEKRYEDFILRGGGWYYKDRLGRSRGPMEIINMKTAWAAGVIDRNTFVWGDNMDEWAPIGHIYGLEKVIATGEARLAANVNHFVHKVSTSRNLFSPKKGHELNTIMKLKKSALEEQEREANILRNHNGWPAVKVPSHVLGLWSGGSKLTNWMTRKDSTMPDKFVSYRVRKELAKVIPGLRPWEVLEVEQIWDLVTYHKGFYKERLGNQIGLPDYIGELPENFYAGLRKQLPRVKRTVRVSKQILQDAEESGQMAKVNKLLEGSRN